MFSGVINPKLSKVKALTPEEHSNGKKNGNQMKAKASVAVKDAVSGKFEMEHCEITFMGDPERQMFIQAFTQVTKTEA